ncbi:DUF4232 domain-containing protein [Streptomyces telluris]|uniref:DUF4232 domain-containing protein n=1 Tax=Streptomyces telluris TaxID=2720021 RepID=A0A9X2LEV3_9ACTN|nr:DUF4232 domain-containing protein [Streptomyces telluris]MCQ8769883.1 DUF4232 domain-containing protein [Streptomyces telluris]NJP77755.1 DUF4232 domain-containing protein [Streptomyces telluris]
MRTTARITATGFALTAVLLAGTGTAAATTAQAQAGGSAEAAIPACSLSNTKVTVQNVSRPINHQLLTATNTSSKPCFAYAHPHLAFDAAQHVVPVVKDSIPQAVVTLEPGESAYAGINLSAADGSGTDGRTASVLRVSFDEGAGTQSRARTVKLPEDTWVDSKAAVTYWQSDVESALMW